MKPSSANAAGRVQIEVVEEQVGNVDPKTNFRLIIIQTELERFKFLVRSFLRTRMAKVWLLRSVDLCHCSYISFPD